MSLRVAILGELAAEDLSGYDIVKRFADRLNAVWFATQSAIYTELNRMEREGLVTFVAGPRGRKTYSLTDLGREQARELLRTPPQRQPRDELMLRVFQLWQLPPDEAREQLAQILDAYRERLALYTERAAEVPKPEEITADKDFFSRVALEAGLRHEAAMTEWAEWAIETLDRRVEGRRRSRPRATQQ